MSRRIVFVGPPPAQEPFVPLWSCRGAGARFEGLILSQQVGGLWVHFDGGRSVPCAKDDPAKAALQCPFCTAGMTRRWKGYLAVQCARTGRVGVLELTAAAVHHCPAVYGTPDTLRGCRVKAWRLGNKPTSAMRMEIIPCLPAGADALPPCPDVARVLVNIFHGGSDAARE